MEFRPPCAVLESASLEVFQNAVGVALGDRVWWWTRWCWGNGWARWSERCFPTSVIPWSGYLWMHTYVSMFFQFVTTPQSPWVPAQILPSTQEWCQWFICIQVPPTDVHIKSLWEAQSWTSHCFHVYSFFFVVFLIDLNLILNEVLLEAGKNLAKW